jgi:hypothetical protein
MSPPGNNAQFDSGRNGAWLVCTELRALHARHALSVPVFTELGVALDLQIQCKSGFDGALGEFGNLQSGSICTKKGATSQEGWIEGRWRNMARSVGFG